MFFPVKLDSIFNSEIIIDPIFEISTIKILFLISLDCIGHNHDQIRLNSFESQREIFRRGTQFFLLINVGAVVFQISAHPRLEESGTTIKLSRKQNINTRISTQTILIFSGYL